jgi:trehalose 2-sulfotransferase
MNSPLSQTNGAGNDSAILENRATRHILLCATHRTGSNLLEQYLKASKVAGRPREYYSPSLSGRFAESLGLPSPDEDFRGYQEAIQRTWTTPNGVFSAKVMYRHMAHIQKSLGLDGHPWDAILVAHPNAEVVHVTRRDKVKQAISMVRAKQSGLYSTVHLDYGRQTEVKVGEYDFHGILFHVDKFEKEDAAWEALFKERGIQPRVVVFEEFIKDPKAGAEKLLADLGLAPPDDWELPRVQNRKQSDEISAQWRDRFLEDMKRVDELKDDKRERRHRARKALEKHENRLARWKRWESSAVGRVFTRVEKLWAKAPNIDPSETRGDGVERLD